MIFNSISFLVFFAVVFFLYYFPLKEKTKAQNWLLLLASFFFYGYADWRMLPLLLIATTIFYFLGIAINTNTGKKASRLTTLGILVGVGLLLYFKYLNFFIESFSELINSFGLKVSWNTLNIILPLGISFFTFRLISYLIEIQRGKIEPTKDFVAFATYVSFFPTIMSGPIDRPNNFIPQLQTKRSFDYSLAVDGCRQILWGLFQKIVIADNLGRYIDAGWSDIPNQSGSTLLMIAILYSVQLYTDFSGYSHMAIGVGKIFGFRITKNFNNPYFSRNIAEFWRNWHISLTSWLTDYVFMPLNIKFRNLGNLGTILAIIINMIFVGLWHGSNLTFVIFGIFHGLLFIPLIITGSIFKKKKLKANKLGLPSLGDFFKICTTFLLLTLSLIVFRAENMGQAFEYMSGIVSNSLFTFPILDVDKYIKLYYLLIILFFSIEWIGRNGEFAIADLGRKWYRPIRWSFYALIIFAIGMFIATDESPFIYFQF